MLNKILKIWLILLLPLVPVVSYGQVSVPQWVNDIGGPESSSSVPSTVKTDSQNNIYIVGIFSGTVDFDPTAGVYNLTSVGGSFDSYLAKYTPAGKLIWAVSVGGAGLDQANSMTLDAAGNATIAGQYDSALMDADPGPGTSTLQNMGGSDAFLVRFDTDGRFTWAKSIGAAGTDYGGKVTASANGNVIWAVPFQQTVTVEGKSFTSTSGGFNALFVLYNAGGNLVWALNFADSGDCLPRYSSFDKNGDIVLSGTYSNNVNFNPLGTPAYSDGHGASTFLAKYSASGALIWVTSVLGSVTNGNTNLCINTNNEIYLDGPFSESLTFAGGKSISATGPQDIFIAKYTANGTFLQAKNIGGTSASLYNYGMDISKDNYIYISGYFNGTADFDPSVTASANITYHGQRDLFLAKYDTDLNYKWAFNAGNAGCNQTLGRNITIDDNNAVLLVGSFCSKGNFDASGCAPYNLTAQSDTRDSFIAKYVQNTASANSQITKFSVPDESTPAIIDQTNLKVTLTVPEGTDITALKPNIATTAGSTISPASGAAQNFTSTVTYQVAKNCAVLNYAVVVVFDTATEITACPGNGRALKGEVVTTAPDSYLWQVLNNGTWITAPGTSNLADYTTTALATTTSTVVYKFRRQTNTGGLINYNSFNNVSVTAMVTNNSIAPPAVISFCGTGDPGPITGSSPLGGGGVYRYQWQSSADGITYSNIPNATNRDFDPPAINSTTYYRNLLNADCAVDLRSNPVKITVNPGPITNATSDDTEICAGASTKLHATGGTTYQWSPTTGLSAANIANPIATPGETTKYIVNVSDAGGCTNTADVTIMVIPDPRANAGEDKIIHEGQSVRLKGSGSGTGLHYSWSPETNLNDAHIASPLAMPTDKTIYTLTITSGNGCSISTDEVIVNVFKNIVIPNTFSPNDDGVNDTWLIPALSTYSTSLMTVYNRFGSLVFRSTGYPMPWDGRVNGKQLPAGTYYYLIDLKDSSGPMSGWVAIVK